MREIVTNAVTDQNGETLISSRGRHKHQNRRSSHAIEKQTDVKVEAVLIPDLTVQ